jgi:hypothetical protein
VRAATGAGAAARGRSRRRRSSQVGAHLAHEADHLFERVVVAQVEVVAARDVEGLAQGDEGFGLLDCIDAQVGLQVEVQLQHLLRVARLRGDDGQHPGRDRIPGGGRGGGWRWGGRRRRRRERGRRGGQVGAHLAHEADHLFERAVVAQVEVVAARDVESLAQGDEGFGLLDGVHAQVGL